MQTLASSDDYEVLAEWEPEIDVDSISPPATPQEGAPSRGERSIDPDTSELEAFLRQTDYAGAGNRELCTFLYWIYDKTVICSSTMFCLYIVQRVLVKICFVYFKFVY